ncbi:hypothetical protein BZG35_05015 [Brevundimonas sp. LM2]|uniref:type II toxin-antitoxin system VapC family toxin n=1 Tax=Brevundimonas sp. LM2 TaxID=1938605 RepID=UPI000983E9EF|nr:type II toxin-antitoxin system VapC family toxin [Brevundimonas sp. LM2]AQR61093.1 hypothetical protein BZG35_05015 [Brevundimonas sp. LM2]
MFSLDATTVVDFLRRPSPELVQRMAAAQRAGDLVICAVVLFELSYGAARKAHPTHLDRLNDFLDGGVTVLELDTADAWAAGQIRAELERNGQGIGPFDTLIAGQAKRRGLTLVTSNIREFARVPGLALEDWRA